MHTACAACGGNDLEPGFLLDRGEGAQGFTQWVQGALQRGIFGGAKVMGKPKFVVEALRCRRCGFLNLYAHHPS